MAKPRRHLESQGRPTQPGPDSLSAAEPSPLASLQEGYDRKARLVGRVSLVHQQPGRQPTASEKLFVRWLDNNEQPYIRILVVGPEWTPIDPGWVPVVGMLMLTNDEPAHVLPGPPGPDTPRIIEVGVMPPGQWGMSPETKAEPFICWTIRPGQFVVGEPGDLKSLRIRCPSGKAGCTLALISA